ncbi:MAG TPA: hypothetical protein VGK87_12620 [Anaerolineae bacterium]
MREREVLNRAVTEIPTTLAWRLYQTPLSVHEPDLDSLAAIDIHVLVLGSDIRAPVGVEWAIARRTQQLPTLFLKSGILRTQAAQAFERELARFAEWKPYQSIAELKQRFQLLVGRHLLSRREHFKLGDAEYSRLNEWLNQTGKSDARNEDQILGGAGDSGVILSVERYMPSNGVLLSQVNDDPKE